MRTRAVGWIVGVTLLGCVLWWLALPGGELPLWAALVGQMVLLEMRECRGGDQIIVMWRTAMLLAWPIIGVGAWLLVEDRPAWGLLLALTLLVLGHVEPYFRVWRTLEIVHGLMEKAREGAHGKIHLIGHSLGTFLSGRYFETYPAAMWDRFVMVGGVISEVYDWSLVTSDHNQLSRIQDVRNEHGGLDVVVRAIGYAGRWAHGQRLGTAGWRGLRPEQPLVAHDVRDPYNVCPFCPPCPPTTRLHNFHFPGYMHSTYFFNRTHMRDFWLPYFLGHVPSEYAYFRKLCATGAALLRKNRWADFKDDVADELRSTVWHWEQRPGRSLDDQVRRHLGALLTDLDKQFAARDPLPSVEILDNVPRMLCQLVDKAIEAQDNNTGPDSLVEMLNPPDAIAQVAEAALKDMRTKLGLS
jgi:pimeloyl-ACP methyl ester carboxylesterase